MPISLSLTPSDEDVDEDLPYPRAGNGIRFPTDDEELDILLDDPYCKTFSHRIRGVQQPVGNPLGHGLGFGSSGGRMGGGMGGGSVGVSDGMGMGMGMGMRMGVRAAA
jgi:hypothetical protein